MAAALPSSSTWKPFISSFTSSLIVKPTHKISPQMALNNSSITTAATTTSNISNAYTGGRKLPILLFDVMDTIVLDPFYQDVPAFFRMSMKELLECKDPTPWIEFEKGLIDEPELARKFFKDGRSFDLEGLKNCMKRGYLYIDGVEELLRALKKDGYEMHAFTNYPIWYKMIEDKLKLSTYLSWTFCSCIFGKRKPEAQFYLEVLNCLKVDPASCIFIDDRYSSLSKWSVSGSRKNLKWTLMRALDFVNKMRNVEAAIEAGFTGIQFKNADLLRKDLSIHGIDISMNEPNENQDVAEVLE